MPIKLDRLPYDILFYVTAHLEVDDIVNLGHSCRQLRGLLRESTLCRRTIEEHVRYSREARQAQDSEACSLKTEKDRLAQDEQALYCEALKNIHERWHALSNALPFSARMMGQGHGFCYRQGILCILEGNVIRVSNGNVASEALEIDLSTYITTTPGASPASLSSEYALTLLQYSDEIITVHHERKSRPMNGRILAISTKREVSDGDRLVKEIPLVSNYKLFSRHTSKWLYYGTYGVRLSDGHHEWKLQGHSLVDKSNFALPLQGFFGTDIGSTVVFEIHNGFFYAVSNQTSFEVEEIDWTSFYHCLRFPLDQPSNHSIEVNKKVYRRQHKEGPIHDSWTEMTLQFDERTDDPKIVEARREWVGSSSKQFRTFYITDFKKPDNDPTSMELPEDDLLSTLVDERNSPHYAPDEIRLSSTFHPENAPGSRSTPRNFILARTKLKAYNLSSKSFLDLVEDERCCNISNPAAGPCIRIRVGSRRVAPRDWTSPGENYIPSEFPADYVGEKGNVDFRHSSIKMWPPPVETCACSKRLHNILNPPLPSGSAYRNRYVTGVLDEHALVYMLRSGRSYSPSSDSALGVCVMVDFTRGSSLSIADGIGSADLETHWQWQPRACKSGACC